MPRIALQPVLYPLFMSLGWKYWEPKIPPMLVNMTNIARVTERSAGVVQLMLSQEPLMGCQVLEKHRVVMRMPNSRILSVEPATMRSPICRCQ